MAKNKKNDDGFFLLMAIAGLLLFLPFLIVGAVRLSSFKRQYLSSATSQRIIDIRRLGPSLLVAGILMIACAITIGTICSGVVKTGASESGNIIALAAIAVGGVCLIGIVCGVFVARHMAVLYLGVIGDKENDRVYFPYDMQSYTISDYITLRFLKEIGRVDSVPLSSIEKMTRGNRGKDLYIHGAFGSRGITMSNKQKRDECLAMIMNMAGKKGLLTGEVESF